MGRQNSPYETFRDAIKQSILHTLYEKQLEYWNSRLLTLSVRNAVAWGRDDPGSYAIYFRNKKWNAEQLDWTDNGASAYCLPLHESSPEFTEQMEEIADEFEELTEEKYEAERFLSGLVLFSAPPGRFREVLGETLFSVCRREVEKAAGDFMGCTWNENDEAALMDFIEPNTRIIEKMNERVLLNLVTIE